MNRLFNSRSARCFDVAIDHGFFGEPRHVRGLEHMSSVVAILVNANPDAIQLTIGQAHFLQALAGKAKPALVLRSDVANIYGTELPETQFSLMIADAVEQAVRVDAACLVVNLFEVPNHPEIRRACLENVIAAYPLSERYGMPLMVEPLVMRPGDTGGYTVNGDVDRILGVVRQAVELGADIIKADPTTDPRDYHRVVETAGDVPVLVRGGGKVDDQELLARTKILMDQGARGIVYGRNVVQHSNPAGITRALMSIVHDGAEVDDALRMIKEA